MNEELRGLMGESPRDGSLQGIEQVSYVYWICPLCQLGWELLKHKTIHTNQGPGQGALDISGTYSRHTLQTDDNIQNL